MFFTYNNLITITRTTTFLTSSPNIYDIPKLMYDILLENQK